MVLLRPLEPVMHCTSQQFQKVCNLGKKLQNEGVYKFPLIFTNIPVAPDDMDQEVTKLDTLITESKGNSDKIAERDAQSKAVYKLIKKVLLYAKLICGDNIGLINQSGFDPSIEPTPHSVPPPVTIKKIVKGTEAHTIKVMLAKFEGQEGNKKETRTYIVRVYESEETEVFKIGCSETNSRKLIVRNVPFLEARWYTCVVQNSAGINETASKVKFTLTD